MLTLTSASGDDSHAYVDRFTNCLHLITDLKGEFSGWCENESVYSIRVLAQTLQDGQSECGSFTTSCFGAPNTVPSWQHKAPNYKLMIIGFLYI